jgi:hypothetical protein
MRAMCEARIEELLVEIRERRIVRVTAARRLLNMDIKAPMDNWAVLTM